MLGYDRCLLSTHYLFSKHVCCINSLHFHSGLGVGAEVRLLQRENRGTERESCLPRGIKATAPGRRVSGRPLGHRVKPP